MKKRREVAFDSGGDDDDGVVVHVVFRCHIAQRVVQISRSPVHIRTRSTNIGAGIAEEGETEGGGRRVGNDGERGKKRHSQRARETAIRENEK